MSPAGTQGYYGEETYKPYEAMNMMEGWRKYTKKEIDDMKEAFTCGKHVFHKVHEMPGFLRNMILKKIAEVVRTEGQLHNSK